jgi:hypothetical protein
MTLTRSPSDMPDFKSWRTENLVKFAEDANAEMNRLLAASIANANETARVLNVLRGLMTEYERMGEVYCFVPARHEAYRDADRLLK